MRTLRGSGGMRPGRSNRPVCYNGRFESQRSPPMSLGIFKVPTPLNEPVKGYAPGSAERTSLKTRLRELSGQETELPLIINGKEVRTGKLSRSVMPHNHAHTLGQFHLGGAAEVQQAIAAANGAHKEWSAMPWEARAAVFLKAADLLTGPW